MPEPSTPRSPPVCPEQPHRHETHGEVREDPWHWLRNREDPAVRAHLEAENAWTEARTAHLAPLRQRLYDEFLSRILEDDESVATPDGPWAYFVRTQRGRPHRILCRRPRDGGDSSVILDVNSLAEGHGYTSVDGEEVSPDHARLVYGIEHDGGERYTLRIRDLATGKDLDDVVANTSGSYAWVDAQTLWVCLLDEAHRAHQVWSYRVGAPDSARLVFEEPDSRLRLYVSRSRSGRFVQIHVGNSKTQEVLLTPTARPETPPARLFPRRLGARYQLAHAGSVLLVQTNVGRDDVPGSAVNGRLLVVPLDGDVPRWSDAVERWPHRDDTELVGVSGFATFGVVAERSGGQLGLRLCDLGLGGGDRPLPKPEDPSVLGMGWNNEWDTRALRVAYTSLTTPRTILEVDVSTSTWVRLREDPVPGYDRTRYRTSRLEAQAPDGVAVPISLVYRADVDLTAGPHPTVLYGYGAYGMSTDPMFVAPRVSMLDRGVVFCIAHVRGGGDLGRRWYESGKLEHKPNTFTDFVACARTLVERRITAPDRLVAWGGSAGGLLVGAVANLAPELFRAILANVPFVDVLTTMLDADLPLTAGEWDEWGDPRQRPFYDRIAAYSPVDNVRPVRYPNLLATAGWSDPRVQYWEPAKWIAKLRKHATGDFLLRTELGSGHRGPSGRYGALADRAQDTAWILDQLGLASVAPSFSGSPAPAPADP